MSSAMTGMLNGANPLFTAAIGTWMTRRVPPLSLIIGIAVGLAGTVLVAAPALGRGGSSVHGILLIVAALISSGFALNLAGGLQSRYGASAVTWRAQAVALIVTTPFAIGDLMTAHWTATSVLALSALGTLGTGIAYLALAAAARRVGPTRASGTTYLIPPVALDLELQSATSTWMPCRLSGAQPALRARRSYGDQPQQESSDNAATNSYFGIEYSKA